MAISQTIPLPLLFLFILLPCLAVGLSGAWIIRKRNWMVDREDNDAVLLAHAFAGVLYAVALGLMVVNVQSGYSEVKMIVMQEANLLEDLFVDSIGLQGDARSDIHAQARAYADAVIMEWNSVGDKLDSELASHEPIERLLLEILRYEPESEKDLVIYAEILSGINEMLDMRRQRLHLGREGVGPITWLVVALGAVITIGMTWFYQTNSPRTHYGLVGIMAIMFSLMIFLIVAMDHPLLGKNKVNSTPFNEAQADMAAWDQHVGTSI